MRHGGTQLGCAPGQNAPSRLATDSAHSSHRQCTHACNRDSMCGAPARGATDGRGAPLLRYPATPTGRRFSRCRSQEATTPQPACTHLQKLLSGSKHVSCCALASHHDAHIGAVKHALLQGTTQPTAAARQYGAGATRVGVLQFHFLSYRQVHEPKEERAEHVKRNFQKGRQCKGLQYLARMLPPFAPSCGQLSEQSTRVRANVLTSTHR